MANPEETIEEEVAHEPLEETIPLDDETSQETASSQGESELDNLSSKEEEPQEVPQKALKEIEPTSLEPGRVSLESFKQAVKKTSLSAVDTPQALSKGPVAPLGLEVELSFVLGSQSIPLEEVKTLVEGKVISLKGSQFEASIVLEEKIIAHAQLILVEGVPSLQITKTVTV
ncbi:MAG: FliM/FliN family flagellar motor switch protein [Chthoniobacterales bacterium]